MSRPTKHCMICGSGNYRRVTGRDNWKVYACQTCTNAFTVPSPTTDRQYEDNVFYGMSAAREARWRRSAAEIVRFISAAGCRGDLLDVGFGSGLVLEEATAAGFHTVGIEASHPAVVSAQSRGLNVREGYMQENTFHPNSFDVITMSHVLEHVADPRSLLVIATMLLKPGGHLFLSQTNYLGTLPRLLGPRWYAWVPNEHYSHFSPQGLSLLLQSVGLQIKVVEINTLFWDWMVPTKLPIRYWPSAFLHNCAVMVNRGRIGIPFVGDNQFVLSKKKSV